MSEESKSKTIQSESSIHKISDKSLPKFPEETKSNQSGG